MSFVLPLTETDLKSISNQLSVIYFTTDWDGSQIDLTSAVCHLFYHWLTSQIDLTSAECHIFYHWLTSQIDLTSAECHIFYHCHLSYHWMRWIPDYILSSFLFFFRDKRNKMIFKMRSEERGSRLLARPQDFFLILQVSYRCNWQTWVSLNKSLNA